MQQVGCLTNWTQNKTKGTEEGDLAGLDLYLQHVGSQIFVQYLSRVSGQENWQSMHKRGIRATAILISQADTQREGWMGAARQPRAIEFETICGLNESKLY